MRVVLLTGKGGVGKTTLAAATAAAAADRGVKTLAVSTGRTPSFADVLGADLSGQLGAEPVELDGLAVAHLQPQAAFEQGWHRVEPALRRLLGRAGGAPLAPAELAVPPGIEDLVTLLGLRGLARSGRWDLLVVDCPASTETLRLLALPEAMLWYLEKLFPLHQRVLRGDELAQQAGWLAAELTDLQALLAAPATSVRLVGTAESVVAASTRRTLTSLALHGCWVDLVLANRVLPAAAAPAQHEQLTRLRADLAPLPVLTAEHRGTEPLGLAELADLGRQLYSGTDPAPPPPADRPAPVVLPSKHGYEWWLPLPHATAASVDLARSGDELVLTVAGQRRLLPLPAVLRRCLVQDARVRSGSLVVRFRPDPDQWPHQ